MNSDADLKKLASLINNEVLWKRRMEKHEEAMKLYWETRIEYLEKSIDHLKTI